LPIWELRRGRFIDGSIDGEPLPKLAMDTVATYETLLGEGSPVSVIVDHDGEMHLTADELGNPHTLYLAIDLAYPQDVLLTLIEQTLRQVVDDRSKLIKRDSRKRQRTDKADIGLAVFDQVMNAATFPEIASKLRRPVSTGMWPQLASCFPVRPRRGVNGICPSWDSIQPPVSRLARFARTPRGQRTFAAPHAPIPIRTT
jgi:hypothetical protein